MLIARLKSGIEIATQLDKSTMTANCPTLSVYDKYVWQNDMSEDLLCCQNFTLCTTDADVYVALQKCIVGRHKLNLKNCKGIASH